MPSSKSNNSSGNSGQGSKQSSGSNNSGGKSDYQTVKDGWGSRTNFQNSYGYKPYDHAGYDEGHQILDGFRKIDQQSGGSGGQSSKK